MNPRYLLVALGVAVLARTAGASFIAVPLERLVERNPVVVVGTIKSIEGTGLLGRRHPGWDIAKIQIAKVLKNDAADPAVAVGGTLLLAMPNNKESITPALRHKKGASGVWILSPANPKYGLTSECYHKGHPDQLQPLTAEGNIASIIARQVKEQAAALPTAQQDINRHAANLAAMPLYTVKQFEAALSKTPDAAVDVNGLLYSRVCNRRGTVGYVFLDRAGKVHLATRYHVNGPFREGLAAVSTALGKGSTLTRYGFMDSTGQVVFDPVYDAVQWFSDGLAFVRKGKKTGAVDRAGKLVIPMEYDGVVEPYGFRDGLAQVRKGRMTLLIDKTGHVLAQVPTGDHWWRWSEGLYPLHRLGSNYEVVDKSGRTVFDVSATSLGFEIGEFGRFSNGLAPVHKGGQPRLWGFVDRTGKVVIAPAFLMVGTFSEGLVPIVTDAVNWDRAWGYADTMGQVVIAPAFRRAESFSEGLAVVETLAWVENPYKPGGIIRELKFGYIDRTGAFGIPAWFHRAGPFRDGIAYVDEGGIHGFIDKTGRYIWRAAGYHVATE